MLLATVFFVQAQDYLISFAGEGASTTVNHILVENLTQGKSISLNGDDVLHLVSVTAVSPEINNLNEGLKIYPNPTGESSNIEFAVTVPGTVHVEIYDVTGKRVCQSLNNLERGIHSFKINGLGGGVYLVKTFSQEFYTTGKLVSYNQSEGGEMLEYYGIVGLIPVLYNQKSAQAGVEMQYNEGDLLKFTATSGDFTTIITDVPTASKTITYNFVECADSEGNNYGVIQIGTQTWMVENLKTGHYRNGDPIPNITSSSEWSKLKEGAFCIYNNSTAANFYGYFYNWYAVNDSRNIAPEGWHVPSDSEWQTLQSYISVHTGSSGNIGKALASNSAWNSSTSANAIGNKPENNNSSGFTAYPAGLRKTAGSFANAGEYTYWWSTTESSTNKYPWTRLLCVNCNDMSRNYNYKEDGLSVRCVRDAVAPTLKTTEVAAIVSFSAISGGVFTNDGGAGITSKGVCWSTSPNPTTADSKTNEGSGSAEFSSKLTGLTANTTYYVRAYATNSAGTGYGNEVSFKTLVEGTIVEPKLTTIEGTSVTATTAISGGEITNTGGADILAKGVCWSTQNNPTIAGLFTNDGSRNEGFTSSIAGLKPDSTYYIRAYATNIAGTGYGNSVKIKALPAGATMIKDIDGFAYNTVKIGSQYWMVENLRTETFGNGDKIPFVESENEWVNLSGGAYCYYSNDVNAGNLYGKLYNGYVVSDSRGIAPEGWHVPGEDDWLLLESYLGANSASMGTPVKALASETGWNQSDLSGTVGFEPSQNNTTGFSALPGGSRYDDGAFKNLGASVSWWTTGSGISYYENFVTLTYNNKDVYHGSYYKKLGYYIRCVKDAVIPELITAELTNIYEVSAVSGGSVVTNGGAKITSKGVCWGTSPNPTIAGSKTENGTGDETFTSKLTGLTANTTYYVRAYATNKAGTGYGQEISFKTLAEVVVVVPTLTTSEITEITENSAKSGGAVTNTGGAEITAKGICWGTSAEPTIADAKTTNGTGDVSFKSSLANLVPNTTYYVRAYATNKAGTGYGNAVSFKTLPAPLVPVLSTVEASQITAISAVSGGNITNNGGAEIIARGICWSSSPEPSVEGLKTVDGEGMGSYVSKINGLKPDTTYYVRAYATNKAGTGYGNTITIKALKAEATMVIDIDGNAYHTVKIGDQVWMVENLSTTRYRNGKSIPNVTGDEEWGSMNSGAWCYYNNDFNNGNKYGKLYNWFAATDVSGLAPEGWHVPSSEELRILGEYVKANPGFSETSGKALGSVTDWEYSDIQGTVGYEMETNNSSGFNGLPAGMRYGGASFSELNELTYWWSVNQFEMDEEWAWFGSIYYEISSFGIFAMPKTEGASVRCIKDK